jgi:hypothetical protein
VQRERLSEFYLAQFKAERGDKREAENDFAEALPAKNSVARPGAGRTESREGTQTNYLLVAKL